MFAHNLSLRLIFGYVKYIITNPSLPRKCSNSRKRLNLLESRPNCWWWAERESSKRVHDGKPLKIGVSNLYFTGDPNLALELVVSQGVPSARFRATFLVQPFDFATINTTRLQVTFTVPFEIPRYYDGEGHQALIFPPVRLWASSLWC
jgi:hypothetical protein